MPKQMQKMKNKTKKAKNVYKKGKKVNIIRNAKNEKNA